MWGCFNLFKACYSNCGVRINDNGLCEVVLTCLRPVTVTVEYILMIMGYVGCFSFFKACYSNCGGSILMIMGYTLCGGVLMPTTITVRCMLMLIDYV